MKLTATSFSSRKLQATVDINAPLPVVWQALTDYNNLGTFIPSLVENRCLERRKQGCLLYQVRMHCSGSAAAQYTRPRPACLPARLNAWPTPAGAILQRQTCLMMALVALCRRRAHHAIAAGANCVSCDLPATSV